MQGDHRDSEALAILRRHKFANSSGPKGWWIFKDDTHVRVHLSLVVFQTSICSLLIRAEHLVLACVRRALECIDSWSWSFNESAVCINKEIAIEPVTHLEIWLLGLGRVEINLLFIYLVKTGIWISALVKFIRDRALSYRVLCLALQLRVVLADWKLAEVDGRVEIWLKVDLGLLEIRLRRIGLNLWMILPNRIIKTFLVLWLLCRKISLLRYFMLAKIKLRWNIPLTIIDLLYRLYLLSFLEARLACIIEAI